MFILCLLFREDCVYIMNKCVDKSRLKENTEVTDLCNRLPQSGSEECIPVRKYTGMFVCLTAIHRTNSI